MVQNTYEEYEYTENGTLQVFIIQEDLQLFLYLVVPLVLRQQHLV